MLHAQLRNGQRRRVDPSLECKDVQGFVLHSDRTNLFSEGDICVLRENGIVKRMRVSWIQWEGTDRARAAGISRLESTRPTRRYADCR